MTGFRIVFLRRKEFCTVLIFIFCHFTVVKCSGGEFLTWKLGFFFWAENFMWDDFIFFSDGPCVWKEMKMTYLDKADFGKYSREISVNFSLFFQVLTTL